ncbi:TonB-linked SusC/RagA family outer membrane protein [Lacibacter cauensis]|uniref:TonB-linked SusC/RagA family outer membrane protein n=1 Tax=Lacibacter cauensis TaxID=510947 RepID=A0A562SWY3_9BACT|nr:SusC/RagA family TonB-linked outer membrane protein [Lacibacter cauensis]TWI85270.1 TonB-linked SusC/RagA family outer membrane protein [Lacibacter cauensis]
MRKLLTVVVLLVYSLCIKAQERSVSGKITDEKDGTPLSGVSVVVKGTTIGTTTATDGSFKLSVPASAKIIIFSLLDYETQEVSIGNRSTINVIMTSSSKALEEVVVVAYGTQKKESITGSVSKIGAEQLESRLTTNISQALAGAAPGIAATSGNGQPGSSAALRIRGFGSVNASSAPLYVVDGFPYGGAIGDLNTNDIESISLLKDASSTALYGARAANGVVLITTKKGKAGTPKVNLFVNTGFSERGIAEYDRVGTFDYYPLMWQAMKHGLMFPTTGTGQTEAVAAQNATNGIAAQLIYNPFNVPNNQLVDVNGVMNPNAKLLYNDFDWYGPIERNGMRNEVGFNLSSKANKSDYFFSLNYLNDQGFVLKSDYQRINARLALNSQVKEWLKTGVNLTTVLVTSNQAAGDGSNTFINPFVFARGMGPIYPVRAWDASGNAILDAFGNQYYDYGIHPGSINRPSGASPGRHIIYETMLNQNIQKRNSIIARTYLETKFLQYFTFTVNAGIDLNNSKSQTFQNRIVGDGVTAGGTSGRTSNEFRTVSFNQVLNYNQKFGLHNVSALVGHESQKNNNEFFSGSRRGMNLDGNIELTNFVTLAGVDGSFDRLRREGYLSSVKYNYDNRYYLDISYRRDASSRFSPQSRWGNFYSAGLSWSVMREKFMSNVNWVNDLKLRASYGTVGNDELDTYYQYQALFGLGWNNASEPGALLATVSTPELTWEVNKTFNVGLEFGVLKNRISGSIEYFDRGSSKLLFEVPQGLSSAVTVKNENIGTMWNRGIEAQLNFDVVRTKNVKWDVQLNVTSLKNRITKLPATTPTIVSGTKRLEAGKDIFAFYLRKWYGVDPTDGAGLFYATPGITTGYRVTAKGDTVTTNPTNAAFGYAGTAIPKFFGSVQSTVTVKDFSLSFLLNYQVGGKFYDGNYAGLLAATYGRALHTDVLRSWKKPGDITDMPRFDINNSGQFNSQSDRFLIDASYINFRNVTLSYKLPKTVVGKIGFDQAKVYVGGENLLIVSKRKGMNPAESFNGTNSPVYVPNRLWNVGINVTF